MDQERWRKVEELFHAALERAPEARQAFLDAVCNEDAELRRQVELLLRNDGEAGSLLDKPAFQTTVTLDVLLGRQFGPYRIVGPLGAGGMARSTGRTTANSGAMSPLRHYLPNSRAIRSGWHAFDARRGRSLL